MDRTTTTEGTLARLGFGDPHRAAETLHGWFGEHGDACGVLIDQVIASADPDLTLNGLSGYGTDYALDIKRAMGRGGYGDVVISMEEIGLFRGLIPRRPDRERSADVTGGEP